ncbi:hypothetical protein JGU71_00175 [Antrihabitans sp. YC3-6]|uniref:Uncharacterized protein n=1 Tax=Antrihabitans stalagmiti TaxID=2799499 RepID=A0A934NL96_9NOCA|nr:hypothetical protein [Antrihabitans stalagmiti]MBJ8337286.1 hypothetical protein [Antrihabitans stalagmiti]
MKVRTHDSERAAVLTDIGPDEGVIFEARTGLGAWSDAEDELAEAFELSRAAALTDAPVVFLVQANAILGRAAPLDSAVATGLLGGARALAFERRKSAGYSVLVAVGDNVEPATVATAIDLLVATRGSNGQIFTLGAEHLGALLP